MTHYDSQQNSTSDCLASSQPSDTVLERRRAEKFFAIVLRRPGVLVTLIQQAANKRDISQIPP